jgi:hypothetical protein
LIVKAKLREIRTELVRSAASASVSTPAPAPQ